MTTSDPSSPGVLGFLSVLEHDQLGLVGGYLILNATGRPLEFHCTAPIKPNRAQQILFGPTLDDYLYGEQIGQTLLSKATVEPVAVYTDIERALAVRPFAAVPVALVLKGGEAPVQSDAGSLGSTQWRIDPPHAGVPHLSRFELGSNRLAVSPQHDADRETIAARLGHLAGFDLSEPFERIREAVEEAHKGSRA